MKLIKISTDHYELDGIKVTDRLSEIKELIGEVDVEKKAEEKYTKKDFAPGEILIRKIAWINGYNQALEDNKVKWFTREDIMKAFTQGKYEGVNMTMVESEDYIQSLQTKTEWDVEFVDGKLKLKS